MNVKPVTPVTPVVPSDDGETTITMDWELADSLRTMIEARSMVLATLRDDGSRIKGPNQVFCGFVWYASGRVGTRQFKIYKLKTKNDKKQSKSRRHNT